MWQSSGIWKLVNQNLIHDKIKHRVNYGNAFCYSVRTFSHLLSKNVKIKVYKTIILLVILSWCEIWCLTLGEERRLKVFGNGAEQNIWAEEG
jgi:small-conductance mechanosensitive channel